MADDAPLTQEELDQRIADSPVGSEPYDAGVSRARNLLGAARGGLASSILGPSAGLARAFGDTEDARRVDALAKDPNALGGGTLPVNPTMANDFSTGLASSIGAAPVTALEAAGGLPALIGTGAISGYGAYKQQKEDYDARAIAGQLQPGEEPPSAAKELLKGGASNAAFLAGGMGAGALLKPFIGGIERPLLRAGVAYGGTVLGNELGGAAARTVETGSPLYANPADAGRSLGMSAGVFGVTPARHLLDSAPYVLPKPKVEVPLAQQLPALALNPLSEATAKATTPAPVAETPVPAASEEAPQTDTSEAVPPPLPARAVPATPEQVPASPGQQNAVNQSGAELARNLLAEESLKSETLPASEAFTVGDRAAAAKVNALQRARSLRDFVQGPNPAANDLARQAGLSRNDLISSLNEAVRLLEGREPVGDTTPNAQRLAKSAATPEVQPPVPAQPTLPTDETRNEIQPQQQVGLLNGTDERVDQTNDPGQLIRGQRELGSSAQEGSLQQPDVNAPGDETGNAGEQLRGQGELGTSTPQRPLLAPVPESPQTLIEQQKQLVAGQRPAMLFTEGEERLPTPMGFEEVETPSGLYVFNPAKLTSQAVRAMDRAGRQNELLGLGPESKADVAAKLGTPVVVTERTPEGTEVKAAVASEGQAPATAQELETQKTPGNVIDTETPQQVIDARQSPPGAPELHEQIGQLDQQVADAQRRGFAEPTARRGPLPGEDAAAARDSLRDLDAKREDTATTLLNLTPESEILPEPTRGSAQRDQEAGQLQALLDDTVAKRKAAEAVVDSLKPEGARDSVDEDGNVVEAQPRNAEDREAFSDAKGEVSMLKRQEAVLKGKIAAVGERPVSAEAAAPNGKAEIRPVAELSKISGVDEGSLTKFEDGVKEQLPSLEKEAIGVAGEGTDVHYVDTTTGAPTAVIYSDGRFGIHVPPRWAAEVLGVAKGNESKARAEVRKIFDHELSHLIGWKILANEHDKISNNPAGRHAYIATKMRNISTEAASNLRRLRDGGQHAKAFAIENGFRAAVEAYDGKPGVRTGRQIIDDMIANPAESWKYANELVRQFDELNQKKQLTESFIQRVYRPLSAFVKQTRDHIKALLGSTKAGEVSDTLKRLVDQIDAVRQGKTEQQVSLVTKTEPRTLKAVAHLEDNTIPWYGQSDEDQNARTNSRGGTPDSALSTAQGQLAADGESSKFPLGSPGRTSAELDRLAGSQPERLIDAASLLRNGEELKGGAEHRLVNAPQVNRLIKITRPGQVGGTPRLFDSAFPGYKGNRIGLQDASPSDYLDRIRLSNEVWGDDQQYHGVWLDKNGEPRGLVISQPFIDGPEATQSQADQFLRDSGFKQVDFNTWYHPEGNLLIDDTGARNFRVKNGKVVPIDIPIKVATPAEAADARQTIASTPEVAGEASAPRLIEKAAKSIADQTKEYRYLWGKNRRQFKDSLFRAVDVIDTTGNNEGAKTTNSVYNEISKAGGGELPGIGEPSKELKRSAEVTFPLRESGFGDATTPEEILAARDKLIDFQKRIDKGTQSADLDVRETAEKLKPYYDEAAELADKDIGQALARAGKIAQETTRQLADAASAGIDIEGVDNYIRRVYEQDLNEQGSQYVPSAGGRGGLGYDKGFVKPRAYESAVDAMEAGKKLANLDTAQLVGQGEASLQKLIGEKKLYDELKTVNAPKTNIPVITKPDRFYNPRLKSFVEKEPDGYVKVDGPGGKPIYVEQNVAPLFRTLAATSWVRSIAPGRIALRIAAGIKHGTLLFDSYHAARQALNLAGLLSQGGSPAEIHRFIKKGLASLDIRPEELDDFIKHGAITEADKQYVLDNQKRYELATKSGVNFGKQLDNLYEQIGKPFWVSVLNKIPRPGGGGAGDYITDFNKWVFQKAARSAMLVGFNEALERNKARFPNLSEEQVGRITAKEINETFGNMGRQGIFKSKTAQDIARLFILAPQWNDARIRFQGRALGQVARAAGNLARFQPEALGNAGGTLLALAGGAFAANQVLNLATTGKPTWENPDGHKLDAFVPGGKNGFYYSPLNLAAEDIHTIMKYQEKGASALDAAKRIALNKGSGITKAAAALAGIDPLGRPLPGDVNRVAQAGKSLLPIPIFASPFTSPLLQPELSQKGDLQRQAFGMAGIKLDRAESPEQRLRGIANRTMPPQFPKVESPGDYSKLRSFISNEKDSAAQAEVLRLLAQGKTPDQIQHAFAPERPINASKQNDSLLMRNQSARDLLPSVRRDRMDDARKVGQILNSLDPQKRMEALQKGRAVKMPVPQ